MLATSTTALRKLRIFFSFSSLATRPFSPLCSKVKSFPSSTWRQHYPTPSPWCVLWDHSSKISVISLPHAPACPPSGHSAGCETPRRHPRTQRLARKVDISSALTVLLFAFWQFVGRLRASLSPLWSAHPCVHPASRTLTCSAPAGRAAQMTSAHRWLAPLWPNRIEVMSWVTKPRPNHRPQSPGRPRVVTKCTFDRQPVHTMEKFDSFYGTVPVQ